MNILYKQRGIAGECECLATHSKLMETSHGPRSSAIRRSRAELLSCTGKGSVVHKYSHASYSSIFLLIFYNLPHCDKRDGLDRPAHAYSSYHTGLTILAGDSLSAVSHGWGRGNELSAAPLHPSNALCLLPASAKWVFDVLYEQLSIWYPGCSAFHRVS